GGEIVSRIGQESQAEQTAPRIDSKGIFVEEVQRAEVSQDNDQAPAVHGRPELHRAGFLADGLAAEAECLAYVCARTIQAWSLVACFLKFKILYGSAQTAKLGESTLRNDFGDGVCIGAFP